MSVERYFKEVTKSVEDSGAGYACKAIVDAILECDGGLTLARVDQDTQNYYKAWIKVYDTNMYIYLETGNNGTLNSYWRYGIDSSVDIYSQGIGSGFLNGGAGTNYRVLFSKLGDFAFSITIQSSYYNNASLILTFISGVVDSDNETYYKVYANTDSSGYGLYVVRPPINSGYLVNSSTGEKTSCASTDASISADYAKITGAVGILSPTNYCIYASGKKWYGHIRWGGKYDMYKLYTASGNYAYSVTPTADYIIDGKTYKALFNEMLIPVEC